MWEKELETAHNAVKSAARILTNVHGNIGRIEKKGEIDLVTEADIRAEDVILKILTKAFPLDNILSEEFGSRDRGSKRTWLIDPLDGTTNFAHGFPFFAVSVAMRADNEVILGIVENPCTGEYFHAVKGSGAYLNGDPIKVSAANDVEDSLLATGFPYDIRERPDDVLARFRKMIVRARGIRRAGSAAMDLCYVAAGRLDGFWEEGLKPWDTAAGMIIVEEAGGKVSNFAGEPFSPFMKSIVAANTFIHGQLLDVLKGPD